MFGNYKFGRIVQDKINYKRQHSKGKLSFQDNSDKIIKHSVKDTQSGLTISYDMRLAIVKPTKAYLPTKDNVQIVIDPPLDYIRAVLSNNFDKLVAVDIETNGVKAHDPNCQIVGIGIASDTDIVYFDLVEMKPEPKQYLYQWLRNHNKGMIGHNVFFDGAFLERDTGKWLNWKYDTYGMYRQLANEGYPTQKWGLKDAQIQLLNYDAKGDVELDEWLVENGYVTDIKKDEKAGYVYVKDYQDKGERWCRAKKSEMWRAPADILGYYCGVDAASTYQLFTECFMPSLENQPFREIFLNYHEIFIDNVRLLVAQQLSGITIDKDMLEQHHQLLLNQMVNHKDEFINHPEVRSHATAYNEIKIKELEEQEPTKFKKQKWPKEPKQFKKDGDISKAWLSWKEKTERMKASSPELTQHWITWKQKMADAKQTEHLNINSGTQMQWLFYERLGFPVIMTTKAGQPSTGTDALPGFGEVGKLLKRQKDTVKEEGYVKGCLDNLINGRLHPQFRMPGTLTCRLAGSGGVNLQQIPKSKGYLDCWKPLEGKTWITYDFTALEQVVLAELSRDESLLSLYGPNAKPNDVYLFNAALMAKEFGVKLFQPIIDEGYDPLNPTPEAIKACKKKHKNLRAISKVASLGKSYGMGWKKFQLNMRIQGVKMSEKECRAVIDGLDKVYSGVKKYEQYLLKEYRQNNGYIINGLGRPVGCAEDYLKDITNRMVQSTGHDVLMLYISICDQLFSDHNLDVKGIILDFHDESIVECDIKDAELVCKIMKEDAVRILNDELDGLIKHKMDGGIINSLTEAKIEE